MNPTEHHIQSLAHAANALGEQCVTTEIAGCMVTIAARKIVPESAPLNREELLTILQPSRRPGPLFSPN